MLKQLMQTTFGDGSTVELFKSGAASKQPYYVRYELQVSGHSSLRPALAEYHGCVQHALECNGVMDDYDND